MEKNYRNISYNGDNFVPYESGVPTALTEKWQSEIAEDAKRFGFIALYHLTYILAADKQYIQLLPKLWTDYQCGIRGLGPPKFATARERIGPWFTLLERWGHGRVSVVKYKLKSMPYLPLKFFNKETGELERYNHTSSRPGPAQVRLNDLKEYFMKTICIPLPSNLFPGQSGMSSTEKKLRPVQWHKIECRKVAKKIWKKDPTITIANMVMKDEIAYLCEGKTYAEKTIRNWIKDLCPNRRPGKRPKK